MLSWVRPSFRRLRQQPWISAIAIVCLALGVGVSTGFFSVFDALFLSALPYGEADELVVVWQTWEEQKMDRVPLSAADLWDYREEAQLMDGWAGISRSNFILTGGEYPERVFGGAATPNLFNLLQVTPALGRVFNQEQDIEAQVVVLGHGLWQRRFGGRPETVGTVIRISGEPYTVIGVMPANFHLLRAELWIPLALAPEDWHDREMHYLHGIGRLSSGVPIARAEVELGNIAGRLEQLYAESNAGIGARLVSMREELAGDTGQTLALLLGASTLILLLACGNIAHLLLAIATSRRKELTIRKTLGASRLQLLQQLLLESLLLAAVSGLLGVIVALVMIKAMVPLAASILPRHVEPQLSLWVLLYALVISGLSAVLSGIAPAFVGSKDDLAGVLKEGAHGSTAGLGRLRLGNLLSVSEIALALVLAVGAGVLMQSLLRLQRIDPGFDPERLLTMVLSLPGQRSDQAHQQAAFVEQLLIEISALPGVRGAAATTAPPFTFGSSSTDYNIEGRPPRQPGESPFMVSYRQVSPDYLKTIGIPLLQGRDVAWSDTDQAPAVVLVNRSLADRFWPQEDPVGQRIRPGDDSDTDPWLTVIGVVGDVKHRALSDRPEPATYVPIAQDPSPYLALIVRTVGTPIEVMPLIRESLCRLEPEAPIYSIMTMKERISTSLSRPRLSSLLLSLFSGLGLMLATLGVYGSFRHMVASRKREYCIRMVMGAGHNRLLFGVLLEVMVLGLLGIIIGLGLAWACRKMILGFLFEVSPLDPVSLCIASSLLLVVVVLAGLHPAYRASTAEPASILRD